MSAPKGNKNASKARIIRDHMVWALDNYDSKYEAGQAVREMCKKQIERALDGDILAFKEIADRVDGKATQAIEHAVAEGVSFSMQIGPSPKNEESN